MEWIYANDNHSTTLHEKNGVVYLTFPKLEEAGVIHGFSTRMGGVSRGHLSSMNLSFSRGDNPEHVRENYRRIGEAIGFDSNHLVLSSQIHETNIRLVTKEDRGDGILRPTMEGIDALVTADEGVPLSTSFADCVPLIFYDPVQHVAALAHSGWRGTVGQIGKLTIEYMNRHFGTNPADIIAAIGPSICKDCYEVSEDVAEEFRAIFSGKEIPVIMDDKGNGKYQLDLWKANELILLKAGILPEHLDITDLCTCCNHELLFSHRASHGKRGNLNCFITL